MTFLQSDRLFLRPLRESDIQGPYLDWLNDAEVCQGNSHHVYPYTESRAKAYVDYSENTKDALILAVVLKEEGIHIGNIAIQNIHWIYRTGEFAILLGDKRFWGKGFGQEAGHLILSHAFSEMNLSRIGCATFGNNEGMCRLALALGMKQEGVRRQAAFKGNGYLDIIEFGILKSEFKL